MLVELGAVLDLLNICLEKSEAVTVQLLTVVTLTKFKH
jgi:hypothetical protein